MNILRLLSRRNKAVVAVSPHNPAPSTYPYTSFPRGRRPTDAERDTIMARYEMPQKETHPAP